MEKKRRRPHWSSGPPSVWCFPPHPHPQAYYETVCLQEASHRTLRGRALLSLPSRSEYAFLAATGSVRRLSKVSRLLSYHMVGNQDPFLHCLQLPLSVLS
jgi:hypothetical protein